VQLCYDLGWSRPAPGLARRAAACSTGGPARGAGAGVGPVGRMVGSGVQQ
jgi:hypothetical protein